jgi:predicted GNAT family acetyltransferase
MDPAVRNNLELQRFEIHDDGGVAAYLQYRMRGEIIYLIHTETLPGKEGHGYASQLVAGALDEIRRRGWQVVPYCPFVRGYLAKHDEFADLGPAELRAAFGLDGADAR